MLSPFSGGSTFNPFYSYTLADTTAIYNQAGMTNPSLPIGQLLKRLYNYNAILAVSSQDGSDDQTVGQAQMFTSYLQDILSGAVNASQNSIDGTVLYFPSESDINSYIADGSYGDTSSGSGGNNKIAFAIIFNSVDISSAQWDYSIRANYTNGQDSQYQTVACLSGPMSYGVNTSIANIGGNSNGGNSNGDDDGGSSSNGYGDDIPPACEFMFTIPSTKYYTSDLAKPQSANHFFG